jgi:hypothetical protein
MHTHQLQSSQDNDPPQHAQHRTQHHDRDLDAPAARRLVVNGRAVAVGQQQQLNKRARTDRRPGAVELSQMPLWVHLHGGWHGQQ